MTYNVKVLSDIHLEHYTEYPGIDTFIVCKDKCHQIDIICLCGDIGDPSTAIYEQFIRDCCELCSYKTFIILGNHEMYNKTIADTVRHTQECCERVGEKACFLNNTTYDIDDMYRFIGTTLWTDIDASEAWNIRSTINDFHHIKGWNMNEWIETFQKNMTWLRMEVDRAHEDNKQLVILTHHVPLMSLGHPMYKSSDIKSAFSSDLSQFIRDNTEDIKYWFYGHDHYSTSTTICNTIIASNQFGYDARDESGFSKYTTIQL